MSTNEEYIKYKIEKADESYQAALLLYENGFASDAISKAYYAAFYAVSALLIKKELNPKTHSGAKSLFHKEFVFTGIVSKQFANTYDFLLAKRFEADYENFANIDVEAIPSNLSDVKIFIEFVKETLAK